jgi:WD40 repeat protein
VLRRFASPQPDRPEISTFTITPDGSHVAAICRKAAAAQKQETRENDPPMMIAAWDAETGRLIRTLTHTAAATELALSPDSRLLAAGDSQGNVSVWNLPEGTPYATLSVGESPIHCLAFGRDPRRDFRPKTDVHPTRILAA